MTATDELRALLDERGVEYYKHEDGEPLRELKKAADPATSWRIGGASVCAVPIEDSEFFDLWIDHCTPSQAIAATLGRGTCRMLVDNHHRVDKVTTSWGCVCSACGGFHEFTHGEGWAYCPSCGREVVE